MALELRVINHLLQYVLTLKAIKRLLTQSLWTERRWDESNDEHWA